MSIINTTTLRNNLSDAIKEVSNKKDYLLVTQKGKVTTALVNIDFFEDLLALSNPNYLKSIQKARRELKKGQIYTHEEIFGEI